MHTLIVSVLGGVRFRQRYEAILATGISIDCDDYRLCDVTKFIAVFRERGYEARFHRQEGGYFDIVDGARCDIAYSLKLSVANNGLHFLHGIRSSQFGSILYSFNLMYRDLPEVMEEMRAIEATGEEYNSQLPCYRDERNLRDMLFQSLALFEDMLEAVSEHYWALLPAAGDRFGNTCEPWRGQWPELGPPPQARPPPEGVEVPSPEEQKRRAKAWVKRKKEEKKAEAALRSAMLAISGGLAVSVGSLSGRLSGANKALRDDLYQLMAKAGIDSYKEPTSKLDIYPRISFHSIPYQWLHHLRRAFAYHRAGLSLPEIEDLDLNTDDVVAQETMMLDSHLLMHDDSGGYYVPVAWDEPLVIRDQPKLGTMLGSSQRLQEELLTLVDVLGINLESGELSYAEAGRLNRLAALEDTPQQEVLAAWLLLYEATRLSIKEQSAIRFE